MPKRVFQGDLEELESNKRLVATMLEAYVTHYGTSATWVSLGHEVAGTVEIGTNTGVYLVFRTDKIVTWKGRLWLIDHKTAAKLDLRDIQKYEMDIQFSAYIYGASKILNQRVYGVIVDLLVKTRVPQFHQEFYVRSNEELLEFEREFVEMVHEIAWRRKRVEAGEDAKTVFYKNPKECFRYGTCPYRDLCLEDTDAKRMVFISRPEDYVDQATEGDAGSVPAGSTGTAQAKEQPGLPALPGTHDRPA